MASNIYYSAEEIEYMKQLYKEGFTARQIANAINEKFHNGATVRSPQSVKQKASRLGGISSVYSNKKVDGKYYCSHCRKYKLPHEFRSNKTGRDGLHGVCRWCEMQYRIYGLPKHKTQYL